MDSKQLFFLIENKKEQLFELLSSMIQVNTENFRSHGNEQALAEIIHQMCQQSGLECELYSPMELEGFEQHPDYMPGRNLENRFNVTARWKGKEDIDEVMLLGHLDTVEIGELSNWEKDPLSGEISDGKIWGRGAGDNKYALAVCLFLIQIMKESGFVPRKNLLFSAYCDEEHGGSHGALAAVLKYPCNRIVSMDCSEDQIWNCASGGQGLRYFYHTLDTVDSAKKTASAIPVILEEIEKFGDRRRKELSENPYFKGTIFPETALRYMGIRAGNNGMDLGVGEVSFTFYTDRTKETIEKELEELKRILDNRLSEMGMAGDGFQPRTRFFHYISCEPDSEDIVLMQEASMEAVGKKPIVCGSCLSDLSVMSKYGNKKAFAFGMGRGFEKLGGAHQPNEFIECDKLLEYTKIIGGYLLKILS